MDSVVGSGRIITAPIITEDGEPIQDPIVLLEANNKNGVPGILGSQRTEEQELVVGDRESNSILKTPNGSGKEPKANAALDKKVIQWKLTLHQIGKYSSHKRIHFKNCSLHFFNKNGWLHVLFWIH